jgi:hypothetical protein
MATLILKHASASRPSGEWSDDNYGVLTDGKMVGRIFKLHAPPVGTPWMWTLLFGYHEGPYTDARQEPTREAAMAAFAKSWRWQYARLCHRPVGGAGKR